MKSSPANGDIREPIRWAAVELRHLVALRAVAEEGSLAAAARLLGYSQPAVSQQLTALERLLDTQLVERRPGIRGSTLTAAGRVVLRHGMAILARAQAADADLRRLKGQAHDPAAGSHPDPEPDRQRSRSRSFLAERRRK